MFFSLFIFHHKHSILTDCVGFICWVQSISMLHNHLDFLQTCSISHLWMHTLYAQHWTSNWSFRVPRGCVKNENAVRVALDTCKFNSLVNGWGFVVRLYKEILSDPFHNAYFFTCGNLDFLVIYQSNCHLSIYKCIVYKLVLIVHIWLCTFDWLIDWCLTSRHLEQYFSYIVACYAQLNNCPLELWHHLFYHKM